MSKEKELFRVFIGTFLEDKSSFQNYDKFTQDLETLWNQQIRWVAVNNLHMTWKFLGDITSSRIDRTLNELNTCLKTLKPMKVVFDPVNVWPNNKSPRQLVWLGKDVENNIIENFKIFDKALVKIGFPAEKRSFKPHITLGRFKTKYKLSQPLNNIPDEIYLNPTTIEITKMCIIKSHLLPVGPVYEPIHEILL